MALWFGGAVPDLHLIAIKGLTRQDIDAKCGMRHPSKVLSLCVPREGLISIRSLAEVKT
jgi:hypothetical protein